MHTRTVQLLILGAIGLILALGGTLVASRLVPFNSDSAAGVLMSQDILDGNVMLEGWQIPTDNFLTTDILFFLPLTLLFGVAPKVLAISAGLQAAVAILLILWLASRNVPKKHQPLAVATSSLFILPSSYFILQGLEIPAHGATAIMGLATIALCIKVFEREALSGKYAFAITLISFLAFFGDIFALVVSGIPILLVVAVRLLKRSDNQRVSLQVGATQLAALALSFGATSLVQANGAQFVHQPFTFETIAGTFQNIQLYLSLLLTSYGADYFGKALSLTSIVALVSLLKVGVVLAAVRAAMRTVSAKSVDSTGLLLALPFVVGSLAFVMSTFPGGPESIRFLLPCLIFLAPLAGRWVGSLKLSPSHAAGAFVAVCCGLILTFTQLLTAPVPFNAPGQLASVLEEQGIDAAYGTYWSAASATMYANQRIAVYPVKRVGSEVQPHYWLSTSSWYNQPVFSLVTTTQDTEQLLTTMVEKVGEPESSFSTAGYVVTTWNTNLSLHLERYAHLE